MCFKRFQFEKVQFQFVVQSAKLGGYKTVPNGFSKPNELNIHLTILIQCTELGLMVLMPH